MIAVTTSVSGTSPQGGRVFAVKAHGGRLVGTITEIPGERETFAASPARGGRDTVWDSLQEAVDELRRIG